MKLLTKVLISPYMKGKSLNWMHFTKNSGLSWPGPFGATNIIFSFCIYWQFCSNVSIIARMQYFIYPVLCGDQPGTLGPCSPDPSHSWHVTGAAWHVTVCHTGAGVWCSEAAVQLRVSWKLSFAKSRHYIITSRHDPVHPASWTNSADYLRRAENSNHDIRELALKQFCLSWEDISPINRRDILRGLRQSYKLCQIS